MNIRLIEAARKMWGDAVRKLAKKPYYKDLVRADNYFAKIVVPVWASEFKIPADPARMIVDFDLTPTMRLMIHFFGAAIIGRRIPKSKPPTLDRDTWPPIVRDDRLYFIHAVPKNDIAKIIGKKPGAVRRALDGFRGNDGKTGSRLYDRRLIYPAPQISGIMFDGAFDMQLSFRFLYEVRDYEMLKCNAHFQRVQAGNAWSQAMEWGSEAIRNKTGIRTVPMQVEPAAASAPPAQREHTQLSLDV